jgi:hypothetical protein
MSPKMFMNSLTSLTIVSYSPSFHSFTDGNTVSGFRWIVPYVQRTVLVMWNTRRHMPEQSLFHMAAAAMSRISAVLDGPVLKSRAERGHKM